MNLFLLTALPLASVAIHLWAYPGRDAFSNPTSWIRGAVWSMAALVLLSLFSPWRAYTESLWSTLAGLIVTDVILVPGLVVAAWVLFRKEHDPWELGLWLSLAFTMAGIRDFAATSRAYDLNELFLVPLDRILLVLALPSLVLKGLADQGLQSRILWISAAVGLALTGPLFQVLSFAGWGPLVWILLAVGITASVWKKKRPLPWETAATER